ncbi:MAG: LysR substrate-binding domain-containing protein [Pseudomonadota bacterium]
MEGTGPMPTPSLRGLRTFCMVGRLGSFRAAADALFLTASAVSHQIRNLEAELGEKLFERSARSLALTAAGQSLFEELDPLLADVDAVVARHRAEPRRTLRISVQPFFASELFVPRLPEFAARHPEIDLQIDTSDESSETHPARADLSIRLFATPPPELRSDLLLRFRLLPAASPEFRDALTVENGAITSAFPLLVHEVRADAWQRWSTQAGIRLPRQPRATRLDSMIAVVRAAEMGMGAALVPVPLSDAWFGSGALVPLFEEELSISDGYYLVCDPRVAETDGIRDLRAWALEAFAEESGDQTDSR